MLNSLKTTAIDGLQRLKLRTASFTELNALSKPKFNPDLTEQFSNTGFCFIHIPKTGGTTIEKLLYTAPVHHRPWHELYYLSPEKYERWFKFCVVRDPVDRFLSSYDYLKHGGRNQIDAEIARRFLNKLDINNFVKSFELVYFKNELMQYFHFQPQSEYILSADGYCMVNKLISFDNFNKEVAAILNINSNQVRHENKTKGKRTTPMCLSEDSIKIIKALYKRDFELYNNFKSLKRDLYMQKL
jgi:hypothetical protein